MMGYKNDEETVSNESDNQNLLIHYLKSIKDDLLQPWVINYVSWAYPNPKKTYQDAQGKTFKKNPLPIHAKLICDVIQKIENWKLEDIEERRKKEEALIQKEKYKKIDTKGEEGEETEVEETKELAKPDEQLIKKEIANQIKKEKKNEKIAAKLAALEINRLLNSFAHEAYFFRHHSTHRKYLSWLQANPFHLPLAERKRNLNHFYIFDLSALNQEEKGIITILQSIAQNPHLAWRTTLSHENLGTHAIESYLKNKLDARYKPSVSDSLETRVSELKQSLLAFNNIVTITTLVSINQSVTDQLIFNNVLDTLIKHISENKESYSEQVKEMFTQEQCIDINSDSIWYKLSDSTTFSIAIGYNNAQLIGVQKILTTIKFNFYQFCLMLPALISGNLKLFTILKILDEEKLTLHPLTEDLKKVGIVSIITPENFSKLSPENITVVDAKDENYQLLTTLGFNAAQNKDKLNFTQQPKKQSQEKGKEKEKEKKEREISTDHLIKTDFQIPFPKVSHKKEELIKKINLAITGSQHVIDPQTQEIFDYSLRKDLLKRVDNSKTKYSFNTDSYLGWSYKNATGFRLTHWSHGKNGRDRAKEFLQFVNHPHTSYVEIIDRLVLLCKDSSDNNHSLSTFIYEQFKDNPNFMDLMSKVKKEKQSEKINSHIYKYCQKK